MNSGDLALPRSAILLLTTVCSAPLLAQQLPSQVDLKAAYCIPIVQYQLQLVRGIVPGDSAQAQAAQQMRAKLLSEMESRLNRLQLYLVPRIPYLEPTALLAAAKSADNDIGRSRQLGDTCRQQCAGTADIASCFAECGKESDVPVRMGGCSRLDWLPF